MRNVLGFMGRENGLDKNTQTIRNLQVSIGKPDCVPTPAESIVFGGQSNDMSNSLPIIILSNEFDKVHVLRV